MAIETAASHIEVQRPQSQDRGGKGTESSSLIRRRQL